MDNGIKNETCFEYFTRRIREGWHCISISYPVVLLASPDNNLIQSLDLSNDVETLRPNAAGDSSALTAVGDSPNYACVDESSADEDTTYVNRDYNSTAYTLDLYNLPAHSGSGVINSITIYARCRKTHDVGYAKIACKTHSATYYGSEETLGESYANYSKQYTTNPNTSSAWTWTEIDALQVGVSLKHVISGPPEMGQGTRCTQVYVEVNYTSGVSLAGTIAAISNITGAINLGLPTYLEDFTSFTEVDIAADRIQKTAQHIDHYAKDNETTYLYKDYGAAHFDDFTHYIKIKKVSGDYASGIVWMLANDLGDVETLRGAAKTFIVLELTGANHLYLREIDDYSTYSDDYTITQGTWNYVKIVKSGTSLNAYIYSDAGYSTLLDTLTLTLHGDWTFKYLYGCNTQNTGADNYVQTDIENFNLGE